MLLDSVLGVVLTPWAIPAVIVGWILFINVKSALRDRRARALGDFAPKIPSRWPFGMDLIYDTVQAAMVHKNLEAWQGFFRDHGRGGYTVETKVLGLRIVFTAEPENVKAILATQFQDYGKGKPFHNDWKDFLGDSIFTTDLDQWHASRQLIRPQFIKDRVSDLDTFERHSQILLDAIANGGVIGAPGTASDGVGKGRKVDVSDLFFRYTLDAATDFLLGRSVESLTTVRQEFAEAFSEVQRVQNIITRAGPAKILVPTATFKKGLKIIDKFVTPYVEEALSLSPDELATKTKSESGYTFLHALASFTRDRKVLRDQLVAVLLAGRDTTASTLSWTFYELAKKPEIVAKLRAEILATCGTRAPTYTDLKNMKYLQATMNETLRLYPVVPFNVRLALHDTTLPTGGGPDGRSPIGITKDTPVGYSTLLMQRRADLFPAPEGHPELHVMNFYPERWATWQPKPWTYIPFNGGPRICIGQQFALTEMGYTIVRILQRFERIDNHMPPPSADEPVLKAEIVLQPGNGVHVGFWDPEKSGASVTA